MSELHMTCPEQDVILRSGAVLRRNYRDLPFPMRMDDAQVALLKQRAGEALLASCQGYETDRLALMDETQKGQLAENALINRLDLKAAERSTVYVDRVEEVAVVVCGQEHLLIRALQDGENLMRAVGVVRTQEALLARQGVFAFDPEFGYLTSRAADAGTGLCPWAMLHLPLLGEEKLFSGVVKELGNQGLTLAPLEEGVGPVAKRFLLCTRSGFGLREDEQIRAVRDAAMQLTGCERELRKNVLEKKPTALFDRLCRSYAILSAARLMNVREMALRLSDLRLGVCLGLFDGSLARIDQLERALRPCSLRLSSGLTDAEAQAAERARQLRQYMHTQS